MSSNKKYPPMPFDTSDWLRCPELRVQAPDVRALWLDMLCYMWESPEKGVMIGPNGIPYTQIQIIKMIGTDSHGGTDWLQTLIDSGVCGVRDDGAIYNRRMVREEDLRRKRAQAGAKGGKIARGKELEQKAKECTKAIHEPKTAPVPVQRDLFNNPIEPKQSPAPAQKKTPKKHYEPKIEFAEYVHLTQSEYDRLVAEFGIDAVTWMIQKLDNFVGSNPSKKRYTNDNKAIRNWVVDAYNDYIRKNGFNQFTKNARTPDSASVEPTFAPVPGS